MAGNADTRAQDSLSREALEMWNSQLHVDDLQAEVKTSIEGSEEDARKELGVLLGRVNSTAESLRYLRSKARILTILSDLDISNPDEEDALTGTSKNQDSLVIEDGAYTWKMVTDVLESLLRRVTAAESETCFYKEKVIVGEEEIRRKNFIIENMSLSLEEMKQMVHCNKTVLEETGEIIKKVVEDSEKEKEKAAENEEELRSVKAECESLRKYVDTSTNVIETLVLSKQQFQTIEARLVAKSTQLEGEKAQKEVEVQKLMKENVKLTALLDKKEAQLLALNEQCKVMALNASNI